MPIMQKSEYDIHWYFYSLNLWNKFLKFDSKKIYAPFWRWSARSIFSSKESETLLYTLDLKW